MAKLFRMLFSACLTLILDKNSDLRFLKWEIDEFHSMKQSQFFPSFNNTLKQNCVKHSIDNTQISKTILEKSISPKDNDKTHAIALIFFAF